MKIKIRKIQVKKDERGWLIEAVKSTDVGKFPFGLVHVTSARPGFTRGCHYHKRKTEWFCLIKGEGQLFLKDLKTNKEKKLKLTEKKMRLVGITPNIFHSIKNVGKKDLILLAYASEDYNSKDPDTFRETD